MVNVRTSTASLLVCVALGGCQRPVHQWNHDQHKEPEGRIIGLFAPRAGNPCDSAFVNLGDLEIGQDSGEIPIPVGSRIRSSQPLFAEVDYTAPSGPTYNYYAILMPTAAETPASARLVDFGDVPAIDLEYGALFLWHFYPRARTHFVSVGTIGTTIIVEHVSSGRDRFYLIKGSKLTATCLVGSPAAPAELTHEGTYFESSLNSAGDGCVFSEPKPIPPGSDQEKLVNCLKSLARSTVPPWDE